MLHIPYVEELAVQGLEWLIEEVLGTVDLAWVRVFGKPLSGRFNKLEIQTLFAGNTRDNDQI